MALTPVEPEIKKARRSISLRWLMMLGFGGLVALSIGGVLAMSVTANFRNTFSLLNEQTQQMLAGMERTIIAEMSLVEFALAGLARLHSDGTIDLTNAEDRQTALQTSLRSIQTIESIRIVGVNGEATGYARTPQGEIRRFPPQITNAPSKMMKLEQTTDANKPAWIGGGVKNGRLLHDVVQNIVVDGQVVAQITASIGGHSLNRLIASLSIDDKTSAFVLDNEGKLIAHSERSSLFRETPRYEVSDFPTIAMKQFAEAEQIESFVDENGTVADFTLRTTKDGVEGRRGENKYFYITVPMPVFSSEPYTLGAYAKGSDMNDELRRAGATVVIGLIALLVTLIAAIFLSHRLAKPMRRIADATNRFSRLDLAGFEPLPKSRVRELDTQAGGINAMHNALSQFSKYVPQKLVQRILESGEEVTRPVERPVTVMFTDIANFTHGSESLDASTITNLLNDHFELISGKVAKSNGTVDKYLGDGVMAFWGAPEADDDHAANAIEAAIAIKSAFEEQCEHRRNDRLPSMQLRIGIHSGRAIVGNIGGDDRTNYTVIGHTVNVANRIEQLGKDFIEAKDVIVSVSNECFDAAGQPADFTSMGSHMIRGSSRPISLLVHDPQRSDNVVEIRGTAN